MSIKNYSEAAENYAAQVVQLQKQMTDAKEECQRQMAEQGRVMDLMKGEILDLRHKLAVIQDWAARLNHQVIALGGVPVAMRLFEDLPVEPKTANSNGSVPPPEPKPTPVKPSGKSTQKGR